MKKIICLFALIILYISNGIVASAVVDRGSCGYANYDVKFEYDSETNVLTISGEGKMTPKGLTIPWESYSSRIKEIIIKPGVESISSFTNCTQLTSVTIADTVTEIDMDTFSNCTSLKTVNLPSSLKTIGDDAFSGCTSLQKITLPVGITSIGVRTFQYCKSLTDISIPEGIKSIPIGCFNECSSLSEVNLPKSLLSIDKLTFSNCGSLKKIIIHENTNSIGNAFVNSDDVNIYGYSGTYAEVFAKINNIKFYSMGEAPAKIIEEDTLTPKFQAKRKYYNQFGDINPEHWYYRYVVSAYELELMDGVTKKEFLPHNSLTIGEAIKITSCIHSKYYSSNNEFLKTNIWYKTYVDYAIEHHIILENDFDNYNKAITRSQFAYLMSNALPDNEFKQINEISEGYFKDVKSTDKYRNSIYKLFGAGIMTGNNLNKFSPNTQISRAEVVAIISKMVSQNKRTVQ